jgi:ribosome maturation factor RimP
MSMTDSQDKIHTIVNEAASAFGAEIIEYKVVTGAPGRLLRCLADYPRGGITIDVCSGINKEIVSRLEEENILGSDFSVEVDSPGLDRPLKVKSDFLRVREKTVLLWLKREIAGKSFIEAKILNVEDNFLIVDNESNELRINLEDIKTGKQKLEIK